MAKHCSICGKKFRALNSKIPLADGLMCYECFQSKFPNIPPEQDPMAIVNSLRNVSVRNLDSYAANRESALQPISAARSQFTPTREICSRFLIDDERRLIQLIPEFGTILADSEPRVYRFDQIAGYELIENGSAISSGGLGRAAIGGVTFGAAGAIVGAVSAKRTTTCKNIDVKIVLRDAPTPTCYIKLLSSEVKTTSWTYESAMTNAQDIIAVLQLIVESQQQTSSPHVAYSGADELRKFKDLLDEGIINQEEFDAKKRQLLGI